MIEIKIPDSLKELKKRHRDLIKNSFTKALKNIRKAKDMCDKPKPKLPSYARLKGHTQYYEIADGEEIEIGNVCFMYNCKMYLMLKYDYGAFSFGVVDDIIDPSQETKIVATGNIGLNCMYEEIKSGKLFAVSAIKYNSRFGDMVCEITLNHSYYTRDHENIIIEKTISFEDFKNEYRKYNPLQERKEMEEYELDNSDNKDYSLKDLEVGKVYYMLDTDFYRLSEQRLLFFKEKKSGKWLETNESYNQLNFSTFKLAKIKTPPRTLKLEDLNKSWVHKNTNEIIYRIMSIDKRGRIYVMPIDVAGCATCYYENSRTFFDFFEEATQEDIDNLTKNSK